jgi:SAM-dependent methyltransferase
MKESDIRPEHLFQRYLELSAQDAEACFSSVARTALDCVACGSAHTQPEFAKNGFAYVSCRDCGTVYQSPRPSVAAYEAFYQNSRSSEYWANEFFPAVAEARRERIFRKRVEQLAGLCQQRGANVDTIVDVGAGYGIFLEEWRARFPQSRAVAIEPSQSLAAECRRKGFEVVEAIAEKARGCDAIGDAVVCFEVLEHVHQPLDFVSVLARFVKPGGRLMVSTLGIDGFDIQVLWERSNSISPPHHINFLSVQGFRKLFERAGLTDIEVLTPGVLDVDIVRNAYAKDPSVLQGQRFLQRVVSEPALAETFQKYLADNSLSSHVWVLARRP